MIKIELDAKKLSKEIELARTALTSLDETLGKVGFEKFHWPKLREKIKAYLVENLEQINEIPTSERWKAVKTKLMGVNVSEYVSVLKRYGYHDYTTSRFVSGNNLPVVSTENWKATGTMEDVLTQRIEASNGVVSGTDGVFSAEIDVNISDLTDGYPAIVDEKLMKRSGGRVGIMRLLAWQENEIYEMLISDNTNLSEELFKKV